jgi:hypothetical protein
MKVLVASRSGNVGKSTIARHLLAPRIGNAPIVPVESINADESDTDAVRGKQFAQVQDLLLTVESVVIDLGSSNYEDFFDLMANYAGSHEDFDLFVIPIVPDVKQQRDAVKTIRQISALGVPANKIVVLFNMIERPEDVDSGGFGVLRSYHEELRSFTLRRDAVVYKSPIFAKLSGMNPPRSIAEIRDDKTEYKAALAEAIKNKDETTASTLKELIATRRLAAGAFEQLDAAFKALTRKGRNGE